MSKAEIVITPRDKKISAVLFVMMILLFMAFVIGIALAEYERVDYAKSVVGDIPTYLVFAAVIILLYLIAYNATKDKEEKIGIWRYS